jgi:hypothetical protein
MLKTSRFCYITIVEPCPNYCSMTNTSIIGLEFFFETQSLLKVLREPYFIFEA